MGELPLYQTEQSELRPISLSLHLEFLRKYRNGFDTMTDEKQFEIEQAFSKGYKDLSAQGQSQVKTNIEGIALDVQELPQLNPGLAIIRQNTIGERIVDILESCGIVNSAKSGGVEHTRKMLSDRAPEFLNELNIYEQGAKDEARRRRRNAEVKMVAERLLAIKTGIRHELDRLKLIPKDSKTTQDKVTKEELYELDPHEIYVISPWLKGAILAHGLIGFSGLDKLIDEFLQTSHRLNKM